tara:strand:+ start:2390 stop:3337 length:948 start_codon:yes stop_codon:yes gene_type:complete
MSKKLEDLSQINEELSGALNLLQERLGELPVKESTHGNIVEETASLLQRCADVVGEEKKEKPLIRVIHHLACSGGTLITKCIASLPNTFVLNEVHPNTGMFPPRGKPIFLPTDFISQLKYSKFPNTEILAIEIFKSAIDIILNDVNSCGGHLVIREHTHSEYCFGKEINNSRLIKNSLSVDYDVRSLLTVRHPLDSYSSLVKNGWVHFMPDSFDEYCRRYLKFIEDYDKSKIIKYENFTSSPKSVMQEICNELMLPYTDAFDSTFSSIELSGDSGRTSGQIRIKASDRAEKVVEEAKSSNNYKLIIERLGYEKDF